MNDVTYYWIIVQLDCKPEIDGMQDYVVAVHWRYGIQQGDIKTDIYGVQQFQVNEGSTFIPYEDLTEDVVIGWLEGSLDVPAMQESLAKQLEEIINPPIIYPPLPWATPTDNAVN
jgi:hypothetical protein